MPAKYEAMRDEFQKEFLKEGMSKLRALKEAKKKAARIFNAQRKPGQKPVGRWSK